MQKLVILVAICGALLTLQVQQSTGFVLGSFFIQKGFAASAPASASVSTVALPSQNALVQGITNGLSAKLSAVQRLVGAVLQLKQGISQGVLRSVSSASGTGYTNNITITKGFVPAASTSTSTSTTTTTATGGGATKSTGYNYSK